MVVYLVRSYRTYARIRSLTTGTFNLVVKDRIAFRLSGAPSVQANSIWGEPEVRIRLSSKPYKHIVGGETLSTCSIPQHFHADFHTRKPPEMDARCGEHVSKFSEFHFQTLKLCHFETLRSLQHATISPSAQDL